ncbi:MAG TPA: GNAT family N-acetyltransferase [bacterium]|nr:GNAT family N-acetyltransferase [bacterium]
MLAYRRVSADLWLELVSPYSVEAVFKLVEENRKYLAEYLTWVEKTTSSDQVLENTKRALISFSEKKSIDYLVIENDEIVGRISIWLVDENTSTYEIGYWIIERKRNLGIISSCVREVIDIGIEYLDAEKYEISCIVENIGSNRIAQKNGFKLEGIKRSAIKVNDKVYNMNQYGLLREECKRHRTIAST